MIFQTPSRANIIVNNMKQYLRKTKYIGKAGPKNSNFAKSQFISIGFS